MDPTVRRALSHGHLIDITTTGRLTGAPRRIEITFHNLDGRIGHPASDADSRMDPGAISPRA